MCRERFKLRLAILSMPVILAAPTALIAAGSAASPTEAGRVGAEEEPCKHAVFSAVPISLCKVLEP